MFEKLVVFLSIVKYYLIFLFLRASKRKISNICRGYEATPFHA